MNLVKILDADINATHDERLNASPNVGNLILSYLNLPIFSVKLDALREPTPYKWKIVSAQWYTRLVKYEIPYPPTTRYPQVRVGYHGKEWYSR